MSARRPVRPVGGGAAVFGAQPRIRAVGQQHHGLLLAPPARRHHQRRRACPTRPIVHGQNKNNSQTGLCTTLTLWRAGAMPGSWLRN